MTAVIPAPLNLDPVRADQDFRYLLESLRVVLTESGDADIADSLPWIADEPSRPPADSIRFVQALSIALRLARLAEENAAAQHRRSLRSSSGIAAVSGLWGRILAEWSNLGITGSDAAALLRSVVVEPVLTAHPTEAKRATVLECHRELYLQLVKRENQMWTPSEQAEIDAEITTILERLWRTGEIFLERPGIADERRNIVHYLRRVFPSVLPQLDVRLRDAWEVAGYDPAVIGDASALPRVRFSTWVGGDRDGHPFVTDTVTSETLDDLRANALDLVDDALASLGARLSLSARLQTPPDDLVRFVDPDERERAGRPLHRRGRGALERNPHEEPWRAAVNVMRAMLPFPGNDEPGRYGDASELTRDLRRLSRWLTDVGAVRLAQREVDPVIRNVEAFGFHLAALDIRQNSAFHDAAIAELFEGAGVPDGASFAAWDVDRRRAALDRELLARRPLARAGRSVGEHADRVLASHRVLRDAIAERGGAGIGSLVVSMTRNVTDLLAVYLLAKEAGLWSEDDDASLVPVVPLFETIDDLEAAPTILREFLEHPVTRATADRLSGGGPPKQQVMVGYSDSNKDGGIVASLWGLYRAEQALSSVARDAGYELTFFHGRGGTISRGAGPTHRFLRALPTDSMSGSIRLTEQGETISQKYANQITAAYHLELLTAGAADARSGRWGARASTELEESMDRLAAHARRAYAELISSDGFVGFFRGATPIDVIEAANIGSRPSRRTGQATVADLRAIPWVFAWSQARFALSGWFGLGSALKSLADEDTDAHGRIIDAVFDWPPLHYLVSNIATSIATSDADWMARYAALVTDSALRDRMMGRIMDERRLTHSALVDIYGGSLEQRRPNIARGLDVRRPGLDLLHRRQIELLAEWRDHRTNDVEAPRGLVDELLLTVNAIASGLDATG